MNISNSTPSTIVNCFDSPEFANHYAVARFAFSYISYPLYIIFCPPAHIVLLLIFYKQYKTESAYMYQIIGAVQATSEVLVHVIYNATLKWFADYTGTDGQSWFRRSYSMMFFAAHLVNPLYNTLFFSSLFVALSMTIDRIFAIARPIAYKNNSRKGAHQAAAVLISLAISISLSFFDYFRSNLIENEDGRYSKVFNAPYLGSRLADVAAKTRNALLIFGVLLLIVCNFILARLFMKSQEKVLTSMDASVQKKKKNASHTLIFLSMAQALSVTVKLTTLCFFYMLLYVPEFSTCGVKIFDYWLSLITEVCDLSEVYLVFALSKKCRTMAGEVVPFLKRFSQFVSSTSVQSISVQSRPAEDGA